MSECLYAVFPNHIYCHWNFAVSAPFYRRKFLQPLSLSGIALPLFKKEKNTCLNSKGFFFSVFFYLEIGNADRRAW